MNDEADWFEEMPAIRVSSGARLHFGLFDVKAPFGGAGMMIDGPLTSVVVSVSRSFEALPCRADRLVEIAKRIAVRLPAIWVENGLPRCQVDIQAAADSHCGLGSGTQLALATAMAMSHFFSLDLSRHDLIHEIASRGRRSSIGSIGFFEGGLITEDGRDQSYEPCSTWRRIALPAEWRIILACPQTQASGVSGEVEGAAFAALAPALPEYRATLARLSDQMLTSGEQGDFESFSTVISQFNALSGELFAAHQGGCYNGEAVQRLVRRLESLGGRGVGQSSWGPTVFAFCKCKVEARRICKSLRDVACRVVKPQASGYVLERSPSTSCK